MLAESLDDEEIIARVAALDIGKAELVCCVRVPGAAGGKRRSQEVSTHSTMTRSLGDLASRPVRPAAPNGSPTPNIRFLSGADAAASHREQVGRPRRVLKGQW